MALADLPIAMPCNVCGQTFDAWSSKAKYCSTKCKGQRYFIPVVPEPRTCVVCSAHFVANGQRRRCVPCQQNGWVAKASCPTCGQVFFAHREQRTCSRECASKAGLFVNVFASAEPHPCPGCAEMISGPPNKLCRPCKETHRRVHYRNKRAGRRAVPPPERRMSLRQLCERDGWRCHLCRRIVKPDIKWPDSKSATFDHLIPVADGGTDEPDNLRLAHLGCNSSRGTGGEVQLLLFG